MSLSSYIFLNQRAEGDCVPLAARQSPLPVLGERPVLSGPDAYSAIRWMSYRELSTSQFWGKYFITFQ